MSITEWIAASKVVFQGLEFGFCFHPVHMENVLSGFDNRLVAKPSEDAT